MYSHLLGGSSQQSLRLSHQLLLLEATDTTKPYLAIATVLTYNSNIFCSWNSGQREATSCKDRAAISKCGSSLVKAPAMHWIL